jgi:hypothetical protein
MTDTITSWNTDLSSWDILYNKEKILNPLQISLTHQDNHKPPLGKGLNSVGTNSEQDFPVR